MKVTSLELPGVLLIEPETFRDDRGFFREIGRSSLFNNLSFPPFVQENHSRSSYGVIRGLHYQLKPNPVAKLVRCISGRIFDVVVDIDPDSETYGKWVGEYLDGDSGNMIFVPEGMAHGFLTLSNTADVMYKVSDYYSPENEKAIGFNDPDIGIKWNISVSDLIISKKDLMAPLLKDI